MKIFAVFDFDGTISYRDTFISFLWYATPYYRFFWNCFLLIPEMVIFLFHRDRQKLKESFITRFFRGRSIEGMRELGERFATGPLENQIRPQALKRIQLHQRMGHKCVLVSASLDIYLYPWGNKHHFDEILSSRLEVDSQGKVTGKLIGKNCRGIEKVRRLEEALGSRSSYFMYGYGDSIGDREMLAQADRSFYKEMPLDESLD